MNEPKSNLERIEELERRVRVLIRISRLNTSCENVEKDCADFASIQRSVENEECGIKFTKGAYGPVRTTPEEPKGENAFARSDYEKVVSDMEASKPKE